MPGPTRGIATRRRSAALLFVLLLSGLLSVVVAGVGQALAGEATGFRIIAHPESSAGSLSRQFVADAFLKKAVRWPNGDTIRAVDLRLDAPARQQFSEDVLRRSVSAVRSYWQQRIFSGRGVPPPELDSDAAVIRHVQSRRGALGYVSERAETGGVQIVTLH